MRISNKPVQDQREIFNYQHLRQACEISELRQDLNRVSTQLGNLRQFIDDRIEQVRRDLNALTPAEVMEAGPVALVLERAVGVLVELRDAVHSVQTEHGAETTPAGSEPEQIVSAGQYPDQPDDGLPVPDFGLVDEFKHNGGARPAASTRLDAADWHPLPDPMASDPPGHLHPSVAATPPIAPRQLTHEPAPTMPSPLAHRADNAHAGHLTDRYDGPAPPSFVVAPPARQSELVQSDPFHPAARKTVTETDRKASSQPSQQATSGNGQDYPPYVNIENHSAVRSARKTDWLRPTRR